MSFSTRRCSRRASREGARHADSPPRARSLIDLGESGCQAPPREAPFSNVARAFVCRNQSQKQPHSHTLDARPINASEIYPFISKMLLRSMWGSERQLSNWHQPGPRAANTNPNCELRIDRRPRPQPLPAAGCHPSHSDLHVGARHRRRCVDLVLRFDFDGAGHRPARILSMRSRTPARPPIAPFQDPRVGGGSWFFVLRSLFRRDCSRDGCATTPVPGARRSPLFVLCSSFFDRAGVGGGQKRPARLPA